MTQITVTIPNVGPIPAPPTSAPTALVTEVTFSNTEWRLGATVQIGDLTLTLAPVSLVDFDGDTCQTFTVTGGPLDEVELGQVDFAALLGLDGASQWFTYEYRRYLADLIVASEGPVGQMLVDVVRKFSAALHA